jgi:hypothetical protein
VTDWDDMERIWSHVYTEELRTLSEEVRPFYFPSFPSSLPSLLTLLLVASLASLYHPRNHHSLSAPFSQTLSTPSSSPKPL